MKKNVASQAIGAQMTTAASGADFTSAVTVYVTGDNGTQAVGSVGSGACTHEGNGYHSYAPAQAETNYDHIAFTFKGTGAITATVQVFTSFPQTGDNYARLGAPAGASVSADVAAIKAQTAAIETDTTEIGVAGAGLTNINLPNQTMDIIGNITGNLSGSVGSVTGAVGSVTGNVGGNVTGSVGSIATGGITAASFAAGAIDAAAIAADAIGASELAADAVAEIQSGLSAPSAATIADAVWDEVLSGHLTAGTTGAALNAAGAAGDPWSTALPGAYGSGTAGKIVGDNLNATVSSRATQTSVDDLPTNAELATALGTADDAVLTAIGDLPTNAELATALGTADDAVLAAIAGLSIPTTAQIADKILTRHIAGGSDVSGSESRNVTNALRALRNRQNIAAGTGTVYEEDDTTAAWTYAATTTAGNPLSEINPT